MSPTVTQTRSFHSLPPLGKWHHRSPRWSKPGNYFWLLPLLQLQGWSCCQIPVFSICNTYLEFIPIFPSQLPPLWTTGLLFFTWCYCSNLLIYTLAPSIYFPESNRNHLLKHKGSHVTFIWQTLLNLPAEYWIKSRSLLMASRVLHGQLALVPAVLAHLSFSVCRALTHPGLPPMIFLLLVTAVLLHVPWLDPSLAYMSPLQRVLYILWR